MEETAGRTVLVVEDDRKIAHVVRIYLERDGFRAVLAYDGHEALQLAESEQPALIVLDLLLPGIDGREVCRRIRQRSPVPIIMLTALRGEGVTLHGLELGADDYMTKPFSPRELLARVRAVLRRTDGPRPAEPLVIQRGLLRILPDRHQATVGTAPLALTPAEFALLVALADEPGRILSRQQLIDAAFGDDFDGFERTVDVHIKNLRAKMAAADLPESDAIATVYGIGYKLPASQ
jgi:DNA-binding response OmpR family regulator